MKTYSIPPEKIEKNLITQAHIVYILYLASIISGITLIIGAIIAYIAKKNANSTNFKYLIDNFSWQLHTFLWGFIALIIVVIFVPLSIFYPWFISVTVIGSLILVIWFVYRIIKGWTSLVNRTCLY